MIQIIDNEITTTEPGAYIHRIGTKDYFPRATTLPGDTPDLFEEVDAIPAPRDKYRARVVELIRERYDANQEAQIQRNAINLLLSSQAAALSDDADTDAIPAAMAEFNEYNAYVEQCRAQAQADAANTTEEP